MKKENKTERYIIVVEKSETDEFEIFAKDRRQAKSKALKEMKKRKTYDFDILFIEKEPQ